MSTLPQKHTNNDSLIEKVVLSDGAAWKEFVEKYEETFLSICCTCVGNTVYAKEFLIGFFKRLRDNNFFILRACLKKSTKEGREKTYLEACCASYCMEEAIFLLKNEPKWENIIKEMLATVWWKRRLQRDITDALETQLQKAENTGKANAGNTLLCWTIRELSAKRKKTGDDTDDVLYTNLIAKLINENFKGMKSIRTREAFCAWLKKVIHRFVIDQVKTRINEKIKENREIKGEEGERIMVNLPDIASLSPEEEFEKKERRQHLYKAIWGLPKEQRRFLDLKVHDEMELEEIAGHKLMGDREYEDYLKNKGMDIPPDVYSPPTLWGENYTEVKTLYCLWGKAIKVLQKKFFKQASEISNPTRLNK